MTSNEDIMKMLNSLKMQADRNNEDLKNQVMKRIDGLEEKVDKAEKKATEKDTRDAQNINVIQKRLDNIENNIKTVKDQCDNKRKEAEEQLKRTNNFREAVGLDVPIENIENEQVKQKKWSEIVEETRLKDIETNKKKREERMKHFHKKVTIKEKQKEKDKEVEVVEKVIEDKIKKKDMKIGDNDKDHEEDDWSWGECDGDWDGTENKQELEQKKRILRYRRKKKLQAETAMKGKHMVGLSPILRQPVGYFHDITADFEEAKRMAVFEFLREYLQFSEETIKDFVIADTMLAKNDEELIYVTFRDYTSIKDIHRRTAEVGNENIRVRNYIPPQFWDRYYFLSQYCTKMREEDDNMKNYIRFNDTDLEVLVKDKSKDEFYSILPLEEIEKEGAIPKFNHSIVWKKKG